MKKVLFCAAAVAMLGLASCGSKTDKAADTASLDTLIEVETETVVATDSDSNTAVAEAAEVAQEIVPADSAK